MSVRLIKKTKAWEIIQASGQREFDPQETMHVLTANKPIYWSWGVHNGICSNKWLAFKVQGHHHRGWVLITLGWEDLYKVTLMTSKGRIVSETEGLYFDQLVEHIDNKVEKIPAYEN